MIVAKLDTRSRIMKAAIDIIAREGNLQATVKDIAGKAGVNIAAINYYFRSKDNLVEEVERTMMVKIKAINNLLVDKTREAREKLMTWAETLMSYLIDYPGILYMIGARVLEHDSRTAALSEYVGILETGLYQAVRELTGIEHQETLTFKVLQLMSGVIYPVLIHSGTDESISMILNNSLTRRSYLSSLIESIG